MVWLVFTSDDGSSMIAAAAVALLDDDLMVVAVPDAGKQDFGGEPTSAALQAPDDRGSWEFSDDGQVPYGGALVAGLRKAGGMFDSIGDSLSRLAGCLQLHTGR